MNFIKPSRQGELLACEMCLNEIPASEAKSEEACEYVLYYYGLDCYDKWKNQLKTKDKK